MCYLSVSVSLTTKKYLLPNEQELLLSVGTL